MACYSIYFVHLIAVYYILVWIIDDYVWKSFKQEPLFPVLTTTVGWVGMAGVCFYRGKERDALHTYQKQVSAWRNFKKCRDASQKNVLDNLRLPNCATCTVNDKFTSLCIDTSSMCNKALIPVGILPTEISQVIVGGNFLSYLNCNKQKTQSRRSLWSVKYLS